MNPAFKQWLNSVCVWIDSTALSQAIQSAAWVVPAVQTVHILAIAALMGSMGFSNLLREATPEPEKLASWWSYRAADFRQSNRGLLLDHILISPGLKDAAFAGGKPRARVLDHVRAWERPSDHAPVIADFAV
jgi:exodeoxyribonuclease-3